jgi:iron complex transport system substrate-binding protein
MHPGLTVISPSNVLEAITCEVKPGSAFEGSVTGTAFFCISSAMRQFPPRRIVCLTEETVETLYLLGEQDRIVGVSGYAVRPPHVRREKPRVSAFISADIPKILALEPDLVLAFSDLQADIVADLVRAGVAIHVFNQRDIAGILAMIRTLGALVGAAARADQLATTY